MSQKITIDVLVNDYATKAFKSITSTSKSLASSMNNSISSLDAGLRTYNTAMRSFNRVAVNVFKDVGQEVIDFTSNSISNFTSLEQQHAKTMGAMANNYDKTAESQSKLFKEQKALRDMAIQYGITGPDGKGSLYNATEISGIQTALFKAGRTAPEILYTDAVGSIMKFAGGNDLSLDTATNFAVTLGTQFEVPMNEWEDMLDKVTRAADISIVDVEDIVESMKYAGGIASGLDRPMEEVLGMIATMGNAGLKGSLAGTGIQAVFTRMLAASDATSTVVGNAPGQAGDKIGRASCRERV